MQRELPAGLVDILKKTSRAFYLSLVLLPPGPRRPLSLAYLLARAADTLADSGESSTDERRAHLEAFQEALRNPEDRSALIPLEDFSADSEAENVLLRSLGVLLDELLASDTKERTEIVKLVCTLSDGMLWDQERFADEDQARALVEHEQEKYTYLVAGCVGPFWSWACSRDNEKLRDLISNENLENAVEFGKALQWVNILRDIPKDQTNGRLYLPPIEDGEFFGEFMRCSYRALDAFKRAKLYPNLFPVSHFRNRMAVFLPLVLGLRTLEKLYLCGGPRLGSRIKVSRKEVFFWLFSAPLFLASKKSLSWLLNNLLLRTEQSLENLRLNHFSDS